MIVTARPSGTILGSLPSAFGGKERDEEDEESSEEEEPSNDEEEGMYESEEEEEEMMAPPPPSVGATATGGGAVHAPWPDGDDSVVPSSAVYCPAGGGRGRGRAAHGGVRIRSRVRPTRDEAGIDVPEGARERAFQVGRDCRGTAAQRGQVRWLTRTRQRLG